MRLKRLFEFALSVSVHLLFLSEVKHSLVKNVDQSNDYIFAFTQSG